MVDSELPFNAQLILGNAFFSNNAKTVCDIIRVGCYDLNGNDRKSLGQTPNASSCHKDGVVDCRPNYCTGKTGDELTNSKDADGDGLTRDSDGRETTSEFNGDAFVNDGMENNKPLFQINVMQSINDLILVVLNVESAAEPDVCGSASCLNDVRQIADVNGRNE